MKEIGLGNLHDHNLEWNLGCHGVQVQIDQCPVVSTIPRSISCTNDLIHILTACSNSHVCSGNPIEDFSELVEENGGIFKSSTGIVHA